MTFEFDSAERFFLAGTAALERGDLDSAEANLIESLSLVPNRLSTRHNLAILFTLRADALCDRDKYDEALVFYAKALELDESYPVAWSNKGVVLNDHFGLTDEAISCFHKALGLAPVYADAHINLGVAYSKKGAHSMALEQYELVLKNDSNLGEAWINRGNTLVNLKRNLEALASFEQAISLNSNLPEAYAFRSNALNNLKRHEEALTSCDRAIALKPDHAEAWSNRGVTLNDLRRHEEALASYERAIELKPDSAEAWSNRGLALRDLRRHEEALASCERAIALKPDSAEAWSNRGVALGELRRLDEALASYDRAIALKPDSAKAWSNRGNALRDLRRHEEALASYERAIELKPDAVYILGDLLHTQMKICRWSELDVRCRTLESRLLTADRACSPFSVLGLLDDPHLQRQCAELHEKNKFGFESELGPIVTRCSRDKIRVGYFSMDFREHPVAHLMAELIETHDRNKFEIFGFSFGRNTGDSMRKRLEMAFDKFLEVRHLSDLDIARLARDHEIDIAIDLGGYTQDSRPAIFAHRAAPIQINYLGFPGTMGTPKIDYLIADPILIPGHLQSAYTEKVIYLPNSYQVNDSHRAISDRVFTREELGLPESGFVFCCFNNNWKILPETFDTWVWIIQSVPNSVLWLYEDNPTAARNLRAEAEKLHIDPCRLVFANRMPNSEHLARYRLAGLFLDTFPYGAHTTASDALWVGLPVLTRTGGSFASRVASSLLHAVGLPELITHTTQEYESLAIELANNPEKITSLKARLAENRATCPLFDTALFTQHIESAYQAAYDRYHGGLAPDHIYVSA